ncbi:uncharacterized protein MELLADRAFT_84868 [Melampsora larici-populina 98AG31]|uniref:Uncharacterized protein n=1 Tax=Melampsora larici-populina (strain 98AG31 / pathotype 3-4-7) TaxID=747676 RepID=F4RGW8_MELLP|nr:uncharacterized protein MELLADRAFT_84868 [Melampsora larici-populina 98AG31]EGG08123.1 hypothetical protein MELLADRAFT_84868 [Melampsora larici-populina 98AG31]
MVSYLGSNSSNRLNALFNRGFIAQIRPNQSFHRPNYTPHRPKIIFVRVKSNRIIRLNIQSADVTPSPVSQEHNLMLRPRESMQRIYQTHLNTFKWYSFDVGAEYKTDAHRHDHHQRGFNETYPTSHFTKLSSTGLIYKYSGKQIIATHLKLESDDKSLPILMAKMYDDFVEAIDGVDNGITQYEAVNPGGKPAEVKV